MSDRMGDMEDYFDLTGTSPDAFLGLLMGDMARAQERHSAKLRTVDENGDPIVFPVEQAMAAGGEE